MKLCCYFNYAPLYRQSIYKEIDNTFDTQFLFGREVERQKNSGIAKIDYSIFKKGPIEFDNKIVFDRFLWRTKLIRQAFKNYDTFIITGDLSLSYIPFLLINKILGKKVYGWGHGPKNKNWKLSPLYWWVLNNLTGFLCYGENGKKRLIELGYPSKKIHVIFNSLSKKIIEHPILKSNIYLNKFGNINPVLIFIGRLTPVKELDNLIALIHRLKNCNNPCNLVIVGDGPCKNKLIELSQNLKITESIWFFGECYDEKNNAELIYNADLCISPGNVGLTALHALEYGTPVISHSDFETQMPEYEVIVPYKTGLLFEKDNYNDILDKTCEWLKFANGRREEIRHNCYDMINSKWNSDNQIQILKKILNV